MTSDETYGVYFYGIWVVSVEVIVKIYCFGISDKVRDVLYKQNKSIETIQRHKSDTAVYPMFTVDKAFICYIVPM